MANSQICCLFARCAEDRAHGGGISRRFIVRVGGAGKVRGP